MGFVNNIFVPDYQSGVSYVKYDVATALSGSQSLYFVSAKDNNSGALNLSTFASDANWKRVGDSSWKFSDLWTPTSQSSINLDPVPRVMRFGDGYEQKSDSDIFGSRLLYDVAFEPIQMVEAKSLLVFFEYHNAIYPFRSDVPPFISDRKFIAKGWRMQYPSLNNFAITVSFQEFINV